MILSSRPFPILGDEVSDGSKLEPATIPEYMAIFVWRQYVKACAARGEIPKTLAMIKRDGGFRPIVVFDLIAGGDGTGLAHLAVVKSETTKLERKIQVISGFSNKKVGT